jgi:p-methyltransferase
MSENQPLDCLVIGYNEPTFEQYERLLSRCGRESEAYRDLRFSFVELGEHKLDYCGLFNHVSRLAYPDATWTPDDEFKTGDLPNLAAAYLTHFLRREFSAHFINLFQFEKEALARALERNPLCVAITTTFYVLNLPAIEIVRFIRQHNRRVKIVIGGPLIGNHVRRLPEDQLSLALQEIGADVYVLDSQGEATLARIIEALRTGGDLDQVPNIIYPCGARWVRTGTKPEDNAMDENTIDWRCLSDHAIGPTVQIRTARSCAYSCAFCAYPLRAGKLTLASLEAVERELESLHALKVRNLVFIDDTFNVPLSRFKDLCRLLINRRFDFSWYSYFRCSNADEEAVELAARSGCKGVFLGIESGSNDVLKRMNKAAAAEQYRRGIELLKLRGILTFGSFIAGYPGETEQTFAETVRFIHETKLDYYRIQLWYCEPGTPVDAHRERFNILGEGFRWRHETMSSREAMDLIREAFLEIEESEWLPQWSFDFWIIPYLSGRAISHERFHQLMSAANRLLALEIGDVAEPLRSERQREHIASMVAAMRGYTGKSARQAT